MMIKPIFTFIKIWVLALCISSCASNSIKEDLNLIYNKADTINNDTSLSYNEKIISFAQLTENPNISNSTKQFLYGLMMKSEISFEDFETYAQDNGIEKWTCASIRTLIK